MFPSGTNKVLVAWRVLRGAKERSVEIVASELLIKCMQSMSVGKGAPLIHSSSSFSAFGRLALVSVD